jgi:hypothetical protein
VIFVCGIGLVGCAVFGAALYDGFVHFLGGDARSLLTLVTYSMPSHVGG